MKLLEHAASLAGDIPTETLKRIGENLAAPERDKMPAVICFYLTYSCPAACEFCSQGDFVHGKKRKEYKECDRDLENHLRILRVIRKDVPNIYLMGGEPTVYPGFRQILEESTRLGFERIAVNTNALLFKPEILEHANVLVVSLHCDDNEKAAAIYKIPPQKGRTIYENIEHYAQERDPKKTSMILNSVVSADTIDDVYDVVRVAARHGVKFNVAPSIGKDGLPDPGLVGNPKYTEMIDWLNRQNGIMSPSARYLKVIRDFEPFTCSPNIVPGVHPNGDLIIPCPNLPEGPENVNLLETGSVREALRIGRERWETKHGILDTQTKCRDRCHKTCYVELSGISTIEQLQATVFEEIKAWRARRKNHPSTVYSSPKIKRGEFSSNEKERKEFLRTHLEDFYGPWLI